MHLPSTLKLLPPKSSPLTTATSWRGPCACLPQHSVRLSAAAATSISSSASSSCFSFYSYPSPLAFLIAVAFFFLLLCYPSSPYHACPRFLPLFFVLSFTSSLLPPPSPVYVAILQSWVTVCCRTGQRRTLYRWALSRDILQIVHAEKLAQVS